MFAQFRAKAEYKSLMSAIVKSFLKKLEYIMIQNCSKRIRPLTKIETRRAVILLYQNQRWMEEDQQITFYKFLKAIYNLSTLEITQFETQTLCNSIRECLRILHREDQKKKTVIAAEKEL